MSRLPAVRRALRPGMALARVQVAIPGRVCATAHPRAVVWLLLALVLPLVGPSPAASQTPAQTPAPAPPQTPAPAPARVPDRVWSTQPSPVPAYISGGSGGAVIVAPVVVPPGGVRPGPMPRPPHGAAGITGTGSAGAGVGTDRPAGVIRPGRAP